MRSRPHRPFSTATIVAATLLGVAVLGTAAGAALVWSGLYDVGADRPHTQAVYSLLELTMERSVQRSARAIEERPIDSRALVQRGAVCFRDHCVQCHGAPGVSPQPLGLSVQPLPGPLTDASSHWRLRELVWITRHGIRMSGMPAWGQRLPDDDIWAVAAFVSQLPGLSPADYAGLQPALAALSCPANDGALDNAHRARAVSVSLDVDEGRQALQRHACRGCHVIPGVVGSQRHVGPPLAGFARRTTVAGRWPNTADNLAAWIRAPQHLRPGSAMPDMGVDAADARAMAAYLLTLH